jgi:hypothetical protein
MKLTTHLHLMPRSKDEWSYTSTPQYAFMAWCSVKAQGQLYLYLYLWMDIDTLGIEKRDISVATDAVTKGITQWVY